jgi:uncharacterized Zn finger protein
MPVITAKIKSKSSDELYDVQVKMTGNNVETSCTCRAGRNHDLCWHVEAVLTNQMDRLTLGSGLSSAEEIAAFLQAPEYKNSYFKRAYDEWLDACQKYEQAVTRKKKKRDNLKKAIVRSKANA